MTQFSHIKVDQPIHKKGKSVSSTPQLVRDVHYSGLATPGISVSIPVPSEDCTAYFPNHFAEKASAVSAYEPCDSTGLSDELNWRWTGSDLLKSPTVEPWVLFCLLYNMLNVLVHSNNHDHNLYHYFVTNFLSGTTNGFSSQLVYFCKL